MLFKKTFSCFNICTALHTQARTHTLVWNTNRLCCTVRKHVFAFLPRYTGTYAVKVQRVEQLWKVDNLVLTNKKSNDLNTEDSLHSVRPCWANQFISYTVFLIRWTFVAEYHRSSWCEFACIRIELKRSKEHPNRKLCLFKIKVFLT